MTDKQFDDEMLMAFVDGELDSAISDAVEKAMQSDPELLQRVEVFAQTRFLAQKSFEPLLNEPVADDLLGSVEAMLREADASANSHDNADGENSVVALRPVPRLQRDTGVTQWLMPIAASIAIVIAGVGGFAVGTSVQAPARGDLQLAGLQQPGLKDALQTVISGEEHRLAQTGDRFSVIASFRNVDNDFCREFELDQTDRSTFVSVACFRTGEWKLNFTVTAASQSDDGYAPASSLDSLDAYLKVVGAGEPMSASEEAEALIELR